MSTFLYFYFEIFKKSAVFWQKCLQSGSKIFDGWILVLEKFSLKRKWQTWKYLLRKFAKHIVDSTSFTKTVKFSIEICCKMILIGNYTCSRVLMKNLTCVWRNIYNTALATHSRYYEHFAKHACDFSLILLEPCNFLY